MGNHGSPNPSSRGNRGSLWLLLTIAVNPLLPCYNQPIQVRKTPRPKWCTLIRPELVHFESTGDIGRRIRLSTIQRFGLGGDAANRESGISQMGMDGGMDAGFQQTAHATRQRNYRNYRKRRVGHTGTEKRLYKKDSDTKERRERPDILFSSKTTLFDPRPGLAGTEGLVCQPTNERGIGRGFA